MQRFAIFFGGIAALLVLTALGVGLGGSLNKNSDNGSSPITADDRAQTDTGSDAGGTANVAGSGVPAGAPAADAPSPARAFGPTFTPSPALAPDSAVAPVSPTPVNETSVPAPEPEELEEEVVPGLAPDSEDDLAPALHGEAALAPALAPDSDELEAGPPLDTSVVETGPDGKYAVCPGSWEKRDWPEQPCGVTVNADGSVELGEYFGGFDGYFDVNPASGHENCFNWAVAQMFQQDFCKFKNTSAGLSCQEPETGSCVCFAFQKDNIPIEQNWPGNKGIVEFLTDLRKKSEPVDYDYPQDIAIAESGGRQANIDIVTAVFEDSIVIASGC